MGRSLALRVERGTAAIRLIVEREERKTCRGGCRSARCTVRRYGRPKRSSHDVKAAPSHIEPGFANPDGSAARCNTVENSDRDHGYSRDI
jgi:hypothetical protein